MQSLFTKQRQLPGVSASPAVEETYNLLGLNLIHPDEMMPPGESPWTINSRMYARNDGESRVASRTRQGAGYLSTAISETLDTQNVAAATVGDFAFGPLADGTSRTFAQSFVASSTGALTRLDVELRKDTGSYGHVIIEVRSDNAGVPSNEVLGQSSVLGNQLTTSYAFYPARFIDAPTLTVGTTYWLVVSQQDNGKNTYYGNLSDGAGSFYTVDGVSWHSVVTLFGNGMFRYKTYLSTPSGVRGSLAYYPSDASKNALIIAHRDKIWSVNQSTGVSTQIDSGLDDSAKAVRFVQVDDRVAYVNGVDPARWYDGTTTTPMPAVPTQTPPTHILFWKQRWFVVSSNNRVDFSDRYNPGSTPTWASVNFFYVGAPTSSDHIMGWRVFQDKLVIFTRKTKWIIAGSDISTFTQNQAVGTKGAVCQEAMDADRNQLYFLADDMQMYAWNGASDTLLSEKVQPELQSIEDASKVHIHVHRNQVRLYYPKTPKTTSDRMLLYDMEFKQWFLDTDHDVAGSMSLSLDNNKLVEFSSLVGQLFLGESQSSDLGKAIDYKYWTSYRNYAWRRRSGQTLGGGSAFKRIKRFRPVVRTTGSPYHLLVGRDLDFAGQPDMRKYLVDGEGAKWGGFNWNDGTKWGAAIKQVANRVGMSGRGHYLQYRFERKGVDTPVELSGFIAQYKFGRQR